MKVEHDEGGTRVGDDHNHNANHNNDSNKDHGGNNDNHIYEIWRVEGKKQQAKEREQ